MSLNIQSSESHPSLLKDGRVAMEEGKANGHGDVFGIWWDRRNADLRFVLTPWQYDKYVALNHFYRPVAWKAGGWTLAVYAHYDRGHFYNAHPTVFVTYKGARVMHDKGHNMGNHNMGRR